MANALFQLRQQAGFTLEQAAEAIGFDKSKVSRTENALTGITGDTVIALCEAYGVEKHITNALADLARQSRKRGWWHEYSADLNPKLADLFELEADAVTCQVFTIDVITGLYQTREYAEALMRLTNPTIDVDVLMQRVDVRLERQAQARKAGTRVWAVIGEAALIPPVGGGEVMAAQLEHIVHLVEDRVATVQVLPLSLPGHFAMGLPFTLYHLRDGATFAFLDTLTGGLYLEEQSDVEAYQGAWTQLTANALDFHQSVSILKKKVVEHRS
ncbi:transcriptional regulator with XRE-family HTH domain [Kibdelosporangium banguiense]|uniref:Transcriptional regulator with XRE-family HTH domain n=1 Tax=Kibdelosporangium banguiense TaxID=1365924 RepID=A0ABS4T9M8_9PSEU|nr:helix-turn-helix transcriptional regulator [Kibdelosporangium banguiense]MBP2320649.1 transcriptional regulator with XRE-family HTH domain [Kibdelosporangium banguiense]